MFKLKTCIIAHLSLLNILSVRVMQVTIYHGIPKGTIQRARPEEAVEAENYKLLKFTICMFFPVIYIIYKLSCPFISTHFVIHACTYLIVQSCHIFITFSVTVFIHLSSRNFL